MKRYKLKKWYPSLPKEFEEGSVVQYYDAIDAYSDSPLFFDSKVEIPSEEIENNSNFWEECIDFEIISYTDGFKVYKRYHGGWACNIDDPYKYSKYVSEGVLKLKGCKVKKVRRLSDNKEFELGLLTVIKDEADKCLPIPITEFHINDEGKLMVIGENRITKQRINKIFGYSQRIDDIEYYEEPLVFHLGKSLIGNHPGGNKLYYVYQDKESYCIKENIKYFKDKDECVEYAEDLIEGAKCINFTLKDFEKIWLDISNNTNIEDLYGSSLYKKMMKYILKID